MLSHTENSHFEASKQNLGLHAPPRCRTAPTIPICCCGTTTSNPKKLPNSSRFNKCPTAADCFRLTGLQPASLDHAIAVTQQGRNRRRALCFFLERPYGLLATRFGGYFFARIQPPFNLVCHGHDRLPHGNDTFSLPDGDNVVENLVRSARKPCLAWPATRCPQKRQHLKKSSDWFEFGAFPQRSSASRHPTAVSNGRFWLTSHPTASREIATMQSPDSCQPGRRCQ